MKGTIDLREMEMKSFGKSVQELLRNVYILFVVIIRQKCGNGTYFYTVFRVCAILCCWNVQNVSFLGALNKSRNNGFIGRIALLNCEKWTQYNIWNGKNHHSVRKHRLKYSWLRLWCNVFRVIPAKWNHH